MSSAPDRLFTPRFFLMCGFSFTVFLSAFQLLPTAPFRVLDLGGDTFAAGMFLGFLTYASAVSAPLTGAIADRVGRRRTLVTASLVIAALTFGYALTTSYRVLLALALVHGVFWSALLSASSAYMMGLIPAQRRAEGIGYWGMFTVFSTALGPTLGLLIYRSGWRPLCAWIGVLNLAMAVIAWRMQDDGERPAPAGSWLGAGMFEWRVTVLAFTLFLYCFGYGGITSFSALYADANGVVPRGLYFMVFALTILTTRPFVLRLADRVGHQRVFLPCVGLVVLAYLTLAVSGSAPWLVASALLFGLGFGSAYPIFAAMITQHVSASRRGAAFGGILAALDTGIGSGSMAIGWVVERHGFGMAWAVAAGLAVLAIPYFRVVAPRFLAADTARS